MTHGVPGIETAVLDLALAQKARMEALPKGHPRRKVIEQEVRDLGILHNRMQLERVKQEYANSR